MTAAESTADVVVRPEKPDDRADVARVHEVAFGQKDEAAIVDAVRGDADPVITLVAVAGDEVVGHVLVSPVSIEAARPWPPAMGLGPIAVLPTHQRRGIGAALMDAALDACVAKDEPVVFVLGDPAYYRRFGFRPAARHGLRFGPEDDDRFEAAFLVVELRRGALAGRAGRVRYHDAFGVL